MLFVDTSVIIALLRGDDSPETRLLRAVEINRQNYFIPAVCVQEVLQGAKDEKQWRLLHSYLTTQQIISAKDSVKTHIAAARLFYLCRRQGLTIRSSIDCLIAELVIENSGQLLHCDRDFENIRAISKLKTVQW